MYARPPATMSIASAWLKRFRQAAMLDENGDGLGGAIKTFDSAYAN